MPDLDQLFDAAVARTPGGAAVARTPGGAAVARTPGGADPASPPAEAPSTDAGDDVLVDLRQLVQDWNRDHDPEAPARRRSRLASATSVLAGHIGSQPTNRVTPPVPEDDGEAPDGPPPAPEAEPRGEAGPAALVIPDRTRTDRRQARKEIDRLQRECARRPLPVDGEETGDVRLLGSVPASPAALHGPPARPRPMLPEAVPTPAEPEVVGPEAVTAPVLPEADVVEDDPPSPLLADDDGVATEPADLAPNPQGRRARRRAWKEEERARRAAAVGQVRFPLFTRSVLVWSFVFLLAGLAFGVSAAFWWSQFNSEVHAIRGETSSFGEQVQGAASALDAQRAGALAEIDAAMEPLARLAQPGRAPEVAAAAAPSLFLVETLTEDGAPSVGSAFVVGATEDQALLLTSLDVVAAGTTAPGPDILVRQGDRELPATLWAWDVDRDLALLLVDDPALPALPWATDDQAGAAVGSGVFSVGGIGGAGATAVPGLVVDQSAAGFQHTATVGTAYRGGPVLTADGTVLGIASTAYQPLGFDPGDVRFGVPITDACIALLACGDGTPTQGAEGGAPLADPPAETAPAETAPAEG